MARDRRSYMKEYNKQYYQKNSVAIKGHVRKRETEIQEFIRQQKIGLSCKRCGINDFRVLDFHHINKNEKDRSLAMAPYQGWTNERILQEIAKCEVLCANCHRIVHWENGTIGT